MEIRFQAGYLDVVRLTRALQKDRWTVRVLAWLGGACLAIGLYALVSDSLAREVTVTLLGAGALIIVLMAVLPFSFAWLVRSGNPLWRGEQTYDLDGRGITSRHAAATGFRSWAEVSRYRETRRFFLLYASRECVCFIPKSAVPAGGLDSLRKLISISLGRAIDRPPPEAIDAADALFTGRFTWTLGSLFRASMQLSLHGSHLMIWSLMFMLGLVLWNGWPYVSAQLRRGGISSLHPGLLALFAAPLLVVVIGAPLAGWLTARRHLRNSPGARGEQVIHIDEDGLRASGGLHAGSIAWSGFRRIVETREFFLFCPGRVAAVAVPRLAFDRDQWPSLRDLLHAKVGDRYVRKTRD